MRHGNDCIGFLDPPYRVFEPVPNRMSLWGNLAPQFHITEKDATILGADDFRKFRERLFADWSPYLDLKNNHFIVEKDIENLVRGRFFQAMFGSENTAFIYVIRHPLAHYTSTNPDAIDLEAHIKAWLKFYTIMDEDLRYLKHYMVYHEEYMVSRTQEIVTMMKNVGGYTGDFAFKIVMDEAVAISMATDHRRLVFNGDRGGV
jgi:hypothetical protein